MFTKGEVHYKEEMCLLALQWHMFMKSDITMIPWENDMKIKKIVGGWGVMEKEERRGSNPHQFVSLKSMTFQAKFVAYMYLYLHTLLAMQKCPKFIFSFLLIFSFRLSVFH